MKKVILAAFMLIAVGGATMAQTAQKKEAPATSKTTKKHHAQKHHKKAHQAKTETGTTKK